MDLQSKNFRNWFTLFFIPIFPISAKKRFTACPKCGARFQVSPEELRERLAAGERQQSQQSIALYNSLRASPANSVTLNELMQLYASLKEFDQAIGAARQFPEALNNSEQCMSTLGRIHLAKDEHAEAIRCFEKALERNSGLGEAHYFKAVAHLLATPPAPALAVPAARAARNAGYPNAENLLREAEDKARASA